MGVTIGLVILATSLFSAAAMWNGPGGSLANWLTNG